MTEQKVYNCHLEFGKKFVAWLISKQETPKEGDEPTTRHIEVIGESIGDLYAYPDGRREWHADVELLRKTNVKPDCTFAVVDLHDGTIKTDCTSLYAIQGAIDTILLNGEQAIKDTERGRKQWARWDFWERMKTEGKKRGLMLEVLTNEEYGGFAGHTWKYTDEGKKRPDRMHDVIIRDGWNIHNRTNGRGPCSEFTVRDVDFQDKEQTDALLQEMIKWMESEN